MGAYDTIGTIFSVAVDGDSPMEYTPFCVNSLDPIGFTSSLIDVTTLCSTAKEFRQGLKEGQEINVEAFYDTQDAVQRFLRVSQRTGEVVNFKITLSDDSPSTEITFGALVTGWNTGAAVDGVYPLRVTLKPTGDITWSDDDD